MTSASDVDPTGITDRHSFGRQLSALRERAGLSTRELARDSGVPLGTLGGYLSGSHLPTAGSRHVLVAIVGCCGVTGTAAEAWVEAAARARRGGSAPRR